MKHFLLSLLMLAGMVGYAQTCGVPATVSASVATATSANLSWAAPATGTPTGYQYAVTTSASPPTSGTATTTRSVTGYSITANTTYYLHVRTNCSGTYSSWTTSASFIAVPGDTCAMAVNLATLTSPHSASTTGAANNYNSCSGTAGPDVIYYISVAAGSTLSIGQTSNNYNSVNFIGYGGSCPGSNQINCFDDDDYTTTTWTNITGSAQTVYWVQDGSGSASGNFTLAWSVTVPCPVPSNPSATITDTAANLTWTAPSTGSPTGYQYAVTTSATPPSTGTATTTSTSITGYSLSAGSTYYLHVRTNCSGSYSAWVTSAGFRIPYAGDTCENAIDLATVTSPINGTTVGAGSDFSFSCGSNSAPDIIFYRDVANGSTITFTTSTQWDSRVYMRYGGACPGNISLYCHDDPNTSTTEWTNTTGESQRVYWIQDGYSSNSGTFTLSWSVVTNCGLPSNISATTTSATTADFNWTAGATGNPTGYQYAVTTSATPPATGTNTTSTSVSNYAITAGNTYYIHVRTNCSGTYSNWVTYTFYSGYCRPAPGMSMGNGIVNVTLGTLNNSSQSQSETYSNYASQVTNVGQGSTQTFSITVDSPNYDYNVAIWVDWNNDLDFEDAGETIYTGVLQTGIETLSGSFTVPSTATTGNHRLRIGSVYYYTTTPCYSGSWGSYEDYTVNVTTPCSVPTALSATATSDTRANLSWTAPTTGTPTNYQYAVSASATPPATGTTTTATSITNFSLTTSGALYLHVRSNCSGTYSDWVTLSFNAGHCRPAPSNSLGYGITNVTLGTINNNTYLETGNYGNYSSQVVNAGQGTTQTFSITFDYSGYTYNTAIWVDWNNDNDFDDASESVYTGASAQTYPAVISGSFTVPASASLGNHRLRIGSAYFYTPTPCYTGDYGAFEDYTINVTTPCSEPVSVLATVTSSTRATLSWSAPSSGAPTNYQYSVSSSATPPATGTTTTSTSISNYSVTSGSNYLHVRSNCSGSYSSWVTYQFSTGVCTPAPSSSLGQGITNVTLGSINNTTGAETGNYGNFSSQVANVGQGSVQTFGVNFNYSGYNYNTIVWVDWNNDSDFEDTGEMVFNGTSVDTYPIANITGSFTVPASTPYGNYRLRIGSTYYSYTPTPCYTGDYGSYEDYTINVTAPCTAPTNATATATSTVATLSWTAPSSGTPTNYQYAISTVATPPATGSVTTGTSVSNYNLIAGGMYYLHVRSNCSGTYSEWVTSAPFQAGGQTGDSCATALDLSTLTSPYASSTTGAYDNHASPCYETQSPDLIYYMVVPIGGTLAISQNSSYGAVNYMGYGGTCPGQTQINCWYYNNNQTNTWTNNTGAEQTVYWVQDGAYASGSFTLSWSLTVPCGLPSGVTGTATSATAANLSWAAPTTSTPTGYQYAVTTSATPPANGSSTSATSITGYTISAGVTYYLHVRAVCSGSNGAWVTSAPFNGVSPADTCATALDLDTLTSPYTSSTIGAADNFYYPECDGEVGAPDQVYYIAVPNNMTLTISQSNNYDSLHRVAYGGSCPGTTLIACVDIEETAPIVWTNTTGAGRRVYWVQDGYNGGGAYTLTWSLTSACATPAPTASAQTLPAGSTVAALTATGTALQWYSIAAGGTALSSATVLATGTYYVSQTLNGCEGARTAVSVTISTQTAPPTASAQSLCNGATVANLTATGTALKWYTTQTGGTQLASTTVLATGNYYVSQTLNGTESQRTPVGVTINTTAAPTASAQTFCNGTTVSNLTATGTALKWYSVATGGTQLASTTVLATGTYYVSQTLNGCESSRSTVSVTINTTSIPSAPDQVFCNAATVANLTATGTAIKWYTTLTGGTQLAATTALSTSTYYVSQTLNGCESARNAISVTVNSTPGPSGSSQTFCSNAGATVADLVAIGTYIKWYYNSTIAQELSADTPLATGIYYASQTLNGCESTRRHGVYVEVITTSAPTASAQSFCNGATIASLTATGTALKWYSVDTGGTQLAATATLTTGTYYVSQTISSCEGPRASVAVTVNTTAAPTASAQTFCNGATVANLTATGTALKWYTAATGGTQLAATAALTTRTYYVSQTLNSCESTRTSVAVTINTTTAPTASAQTFCNSATVANLTATGTAIKWYSTATGGTALTATMALATGTYYASQTLNSCEGPRTSVAVTVSTVTAPTASAQIFCNGATIANLTATGTAIKWYTTATGGTALTATTALATGTYYASQTISSCEGPRASVAVTVNTTAAPTASAQSFCNFATVSALTATGTALKWYTTATGGTALTATTALATGTYYVSQTLNSCESIRTSIAVTVNTTAAPTATAQTFCNGATVSNLTATGTGLQWYSTATGGTALTATTALATGTYYVSQTLNLCESTRTSVAVTVNTTAAPTATAQTFCNGATVANLAATGTAIKWYTAATGGTALTSAETLVTGTYFVSQTLNSCESARTSVVITINTTTIAPTASAQTYCNGTTVASLTATGTALKWYSTATGGTQLASTATLATGTYFVSQTLNACESARTAVAVTINTTTAPTAVAQVFCNSATVANLTATGTAIKWYSAATGGTALTATTTLATGTYYVSQTLNACESIRTAVAVTINVTSAPVATAQTFCVGATVSSLTATGTGLQWYAVATGGTPLATTASLTTGTYYVSQTLNNCEGPRTSVAVTINITAAPTASAQVFCSGATVTNLMGTGADLKWYSAATGGTELASTTALTTGTYYVSQTLNSCESARTAVTVTVNFTAAPTASAQTFCNGATVASLTATGTAPKWYLAATGGSQLASTATLVTGTYYVSQTLNNCESTRTSVAVTVNTTSAPTAAAQAFCNSALVSNLVAAGTDVKWYANATGGTPLASTASLTTGTYYVSQTLNSCEGARTSVAVTINTTAAPTASAQVFCSGATVTNLMATGADLKWYSAATGGTALTATTALATGTYYVSQTLNTCESARTAVAVTINFTAAPTASAQVFCAGTTVANLTAVGIATKWYTSATGGTALTAATTLATGTYYVSQTLNACESTRISVAVTVNTTAAPAAAAQAFCNSALVSNLVATGTDVKWYANATGGTPLATTASLATGTYYVSQTLNSCESIRTAVAVTINVTAAPVASAQTLCSGATVSDLTATGTDLNWYSAATGGMELASTTTLATGTYYVSQTLNGCESLRAAVTVTVNFTAAPTASAQTFCNGATAASLTATGTALKWYTAATGGTQLAASTTLATGTYYVSQTLNACESERTAVSVIITTTPAPTANAQAFCNSAVASQLTATGNGLIWYADATGSTILTADTALTTGTYYVTQTIGGCESARTAVAVTINVTPAPVAAAQAFCNSATVAQLSATGTDLAWYAEATGGTALASTEVLATGTYYVSQILNTCESVRTSVAVIINVTTAPTADAQTVCFGTTVAQLSANGTGLLWYADATGGTALASTEVIATGTYYVSQTLNACESTRTSVAVTVNTTVAPTADAQAFCDSATVANLTATGTDVKWYADATGGTELSDDAALATGTYYVSQTLNSCESARTSVAVTINVTPAPVAAAQSFCNSATVAQLSATGTDLKWYANATGGTAFTGDVALATGTYYVSQTLNTCESIRTSVAVTINVTTAPTTDAQTVCTGSTIADLSANGTGLLWYTDETGGIALASTEVLATGTYYVSQTMNECESTRTAVSVTISVTPAPTADAQTFCAGATLAELAATGTDLVWYADATGGTDLASTDVLATGTYYVSQTLNACESTRTAVSVIINTTPAPTAAAQSFCNSAIASQLTASGSGLTWYADATGGTVLTADTALATGTYYVSQTLDTCESARTAVSVTINVTAAPTAASEQAYCSNATIGDLDATGTDLAWYTDATGGTALTAETALATGTYYVSQTLNGCESGRTAVGVTIGSIPAPTGAATQVISVSVATDATIASIDVTGTDVLWYATEAEALNGGTPLPADTVLATETTYYATQTVSGCTSATVLAVTITVALGNDNIVKNEFKYFPNPVVNELNLESSEIISNVAVYDLNGKLVFEVKWNSTSGKLNMSMLQTASYLVRVTTGNRIKNLTIMKQ